MNILQSKITCRNRIKGDFDTRNMDIVRTVDYCAILNLMEVITLMFSLMNM